MPKYLGKVKYTSDGLKGLRATGAASRADFGRGLIEALGGSVEAYYFAFGEWDLYTVMDLPNDESAAAISVAIGEAGAATAEITKLLTPDQVDAAFAVNVGYRPPGQ
jgi:uncharacterized protein with GYD domain